MFFDPAVHDVVRERVLMVACRFAGLYHGVRSVAVPRDGPERALVLVQGLSSGTLYAIFRAELVGNGTGAKLGRTAAENRPLPDPPDS
jgi:hypothetical protein